MKKLYILLFLLCAAFSSYTQTVALTPTISPSLFKSSDEITVVYDVTGTTLATLSEAYLWAWIANPTVNSKYNINPANSNSTATSNAKFVKSMVDGKTLFTITFTPAEFFDQDISSQPEIGMLLKGNDWSNGQTTDFITTFWDGVSYDLKINSPSDGLVALAAGGSITIDAEVPVNSSFKLYENNSLIHELSGQSTYHYLFVPSLEQGYGTLTLSATDGSNVSTKDINYFVYANSPVAAKIDGVIPGINYTDDATKVTLCLWAPGKTSVYVRGDFTDWQLNASHLMKRDGEYFWLDVSNLTPNEEYAFQYVVDGNIFIADPYADKILDPDDEEIPATTYPDLKPFPTEALNSMWYFNRVAVLETNQEEYEWKVASFERPVKENLVVYELLIRDFFDAQNRSYQNLIDTISYFKKLGVNAIELMPVMEFNGNESWGYNPTFMFAPDKAYGPKNKLKEFIDRCHQEGIAVILDITMNHQDMPNPYVLMDFDFSTGSPTSFNRWYNVKATHPYNVFFDLNHESIYTQTYLDTVNYYWLNEFNVDGFRFDLTKGFTQNAKCGGSTSDEACISRKDDTRIAILKRMADKIWEHSPGAIVILEHFADNAEEKELAEYRAAEGKGLMLWGNLNHSFNQLTMGYQDNSDISWASYQTRAWTSPHLVTYMESHDEDRLSFRNQEYGNAIENYSVKDPATSIQRIKAASVLFYSIPGPKMLWQFGEVGYDFSINECPDGTIDEGCRVSPKPVKWDYLEEAGRYGLFLHTADLIRLHTEYSVFTRGDVAIKRDSLVNDIQIRNRPYSDTPGSVEEMNVQAVANFHLREKAVNISFPHTGTWYDYYDLGKPVNVSALPYQVSLPPGGYKLYTDVPITPAPITDVERDPLSRTIVYPNPTFGHFNVTLSDGAWTLLDSRGVACSVSRTNDGYDISTLPNGLYFLKHVARNGTASITKLIKR